MRRDAVSKPPATLTRSAWSNKSGSLWPSFLLLALVTLVAYVNALPNELVLDDRIFLGAGRFEQLSLLDYAGLFRQSLWEGSAGDVNLYRPMLLVSFGLQASVFGQWLVGYHIVNVILHLITTLLVFGFTREILTILSDDKVLSTRASLLAAMVFGIHPVLSEAVNSVFNGSEIYVTLGAVGGLWYLLRNHAEHPVRSWLVLGLIYFVALLFRESAVSIPLLAVIAIWFTSRERWMVRVRQCLPVLLLTIPLTIYMGMRSEALEGPAQLAGGAGPENIQLRSEIQTEANQVTSEQNSEARVPVKAAAPDMKVKPGEKTSRNILDEYGLSFGPKRVSLAVSMWFDALRLMVWPHPLTVFREVTSTNFWLALAAQSLLLTFAFFAALRGRPGFIAGLALFYAAILPSSRIISESFLPPLLLDRMLYLPSLGLVICLACGLTWLMARFPQKFILSGTAVALLALVSLTWARNDAWSDEVKLLEGDFRKVPDHAQLLYSLVRANMRSGNPQRSMELCRKRPEQVRQTGYIIMECGNAFATGRKYDSAETFYLQAIEKAPSFAWPHFHLARMLLHMGRRSDAHEHFETAVKKEKMPFVREYMSAVMLIELYPNDPQRLARARAHLENALRLQPRAAQARVALEKLDQRLGRD